MLSFDAILHWWSLLALFIYFWKDIYQVSSWFHKKWSDEQKLFFILIIATIPAVLSGILLSDFLEKYSHSLLFLWITFLISSIYFFISEFFSEKIAKKEEKISIKNWFLIWISQAISIIPWISRSWTTLSTWILLWIKREKALHFSFLMWMPIILWAIIYLFLKHWNWIFETFELKIILAGFFSSFFFSIISIHFLISFFKKFTLKFFWIYLFILSFSIFWYLFLG